MWNVYCVYKKMHVCDIVCALYVCELMQCLFLTTGGMLTFVGRARRVKKTENCSHHTVNVWISEIFR